MEAILLIIRIVCRIVIKSVQQCTYFLFSANLLLVGVNYGHRTMQLISDKIQMIRFYLSLVRSVAYGESEVKLFACKEIKIDGNFHSQKAKSGTISCLFEIFTFNLSF